MNPYYHSFKKVLALSEDLTNESKTNIIALALISTHSKTILKELLEIPTMTAQYIQNGVAQAKNKVNLDDSLIDELLMYYEKYHFEKIISNKNQVKKQKI